MRSSWVCHGFAQPRKSSSKLGRLHPSGQGRLGAHAAAPLAHAWPRGGAGGDPTLWACRDLGRAVDTLITASCGGWSQPTWLFLQLQDSGIVCVHGSVCFFPSVYPLFRSKSHIWKNNSSKSQVIDVIISISALPAAPVQKGIITLRYQPN